MIQSAKNIMDEFANDDLVKCREFNIGEKKGAIIFIADLTKEEVIERALFALCNLTEEIVSLEELAKTVIFARQVSVEKTKQDAVDALLSGDSVVLIEGLEGKLILDSKAWDKRSIMEPPVENVLRGPREGFIEDIKTNLTLLQRRIRTTQLKVERLRIGKQSYTANRA